VLAQEDTTTGGIGITMAGKNGPLVEGNSGSKLRLSEDRPLKYAGNWGFPGGLTSSRKVSRFQLEGILETPPRIDLKEAVSGEGIWVREKAMRLLQESR
jgi:hypothetical protein